jgi:hypothetical protein
MCTRAEFGNGVVNEKLNGLRFESEELYRRTKIMTGVTIGVGMAGRGTAAKGDQDF